MSPSPPPAAMPSFTENDGIYRKASYINLDKNEFITSHLTTVVAATTYAIMVAYTLLFMTSATVLQCDRQTFRFRSFVFASLTTILVQLLIVIFAMNGKVYGTHHPTIFAYTVSFVTVHSIFCTFFTFFFLVHLAHPIFVQPFSHICGYG